MITTFDGFQVCRATHPKQPNRDKSSRSRTYHLTNQGEKYTLCSNLVTHRLRDEIGRDWSQIACKNCLQIKERFAASAVMDKEK